VTIVLLASVVTVLPNLWRHVSLTTSQPISDGDAHVHALAVAQNYTFTTVFTDPLVIYLDDFLSIAEIDQLLNERYGHSLPPCKFQ
jgi:hypothetical protein